MKVITIVDTDQPYGTQVVVIEEGDIKGIALAHRISSDIRMYQLNKLANEPIYSLDDFVDSEPPLPKLPKRFLGDYISESYIQRSGSNLASLLPKIKFDYLKKPEQE